MTVFKNSYFIMRHGESESNRKGIIVSDPKIGCDSYGLTVKGRKQVSSSANGYSDLPFTKIYTSDFLRTQQTASLVSSIKDLPRPQIETDLRERYFGRYDGLSANNYDLVWEMDTTQNHEPFDSVESTFNVVKRTIKLLNKLEKDNKDEIILLVSHGDVLQVLRSVFINVPANQHRSIPHHNTAEIMKLITKGRDYSHVYRDELL
jgi:probable phosphoglycerate mutase